MNQFDRAAGEPGGVADGGAVGEGEAVEDAADVPGTAGGRPLPGTGAVRVDAGRHVARREEAPIVGVDERGERRRVSGGHEQRAGVRRTPDPLAFLEQPQAHHVAEVPDCAVDAGLVGEVRPPAGFGDDRCVEFDTGQGPGSGGDVGEVGCRGGYGGDG